MIYIKSYLATKMKIKNNNGIYFWGKEETDWRSFGVGLSLMLIIVVISLLVK